MIGIGESALEVKRVNKVDNSRQYRIDIGTLATDFRQQMMDAENIGLALGIANRS